MRLTDEQTGAICTGITLLGVGALFLTGFWWPGIMFVAGAATIAAGLLKGQGWYAVQGGLWAVGIGVWAMFRYNIGVFFAIAAVSVVANAFIKPPFLAKPYVDNTLE